MFWIITIIICIVLFFWVKNKVFTKLEEDRLNKHSKLQRAEIDFNSEYQDEE